MLKQNQSVEKVFQIIEKMAGQKNSMRLKEIASAVEMHPTTVLRFLNTMIQMNYVAQDKDTSRYFLTLKLSQVGEQIRSQFNIRDIVRPFLVQLSEKCRESTCLAVDSGSMAVYIDAVEGADSILRTLQRIGRSAPLHSTGVGKNLLLNYDPARLQKYVSERGLPALTPKTIANLPDLMAELAKIREQGYALDDEECEIGVKCVAAPIYDYHGKVIASISVTGPSGRFTPPNLDNLIKTITTTATDISKLL